jgi:hypothetical protein
VCRILSSGHYKKVRKPHDCYICDRRIEVGQPAYWQVNVGADWGFCKVFHHDNCNPHDAEED